MARWLFEQGFLSASRTFDGTIIFCRLAPIDLINKFNIACFSRTTVVRYQIFGSIKRPQHSAYLEFCEHPDILGRGPNPPFSLDLVLHRRQGNSGISVLWRGRFFTLFSNRYAPPLGQPPLKSYRDFNEEWSVSSWEVTEPATGFQAQYIRVLAKYVR
jgi:hypothetical protein